jgi:hypothetical protein
MGTRADLSFFSQGISAVSGNELETKSSVKLNRAKVLLEKITEVWA